MDKHNSATRASVLGLARLLAVIACGCSSNDDSTPGVAVVPPASGGQPAVVLGSGGSVAAPPVATVATPTGGASAGGGGTGGTSSLAGVGGVLVSTGGSSGGGAAGTAGAAGAAGQGGSGGVPSGIPDLVLHMKGTIDAGAEAMFCMAYQMPTDGKTAVPSAESHYTPGSHHFLIFRTSLTTIAPGADVAHLCGTTNTTEAVSGGSNGLLAGESVAGSTGSYYEAQTPDARRDLPPGVAHVFQPGEILNVTAHYLNTTDATIDSTIEFRMHRMNVSDVKQEAGTFFLLDTQLNIPPNSQVTATKACPITKDINLGLLWSHMHSRGYSFKATTDDPMAMAQLGGDVYDQPGPEGWAEPHVQTYPWDPPVTLHAGSKLTISCTYQNTTSRTFTFGQSAETAEMCLLHGMYWPRLDSATEQCSKGTSTMGTPGPITSKSM